MNIKKNLIKKFMTEVNSFEIILLFHILIYSNTTNPALSGGKLDRCASGISLHRKWVMETL